MPPFRPVLCLCPHVLVSSVHFLFHEAGSLSFFSIYLFQMGALLVGVILQNLVVTSDHLTYCHLSTALPILTSHSWHQQCSFIHTNVAHFLTPFCVSPRDGCNVLRIPVDQQQLGKHPAARLAPTTMSTTFRVTPVLFLPHSDGFELQQVFFTASS